MVGEDTDTTDLNGSRAGLMLGTCDRDHVEVMLNLGVWGRKLAVRGIIRYIVYTITNMANLHGRIGAMDIMQTVVSINLTVLFYR